MQRTTNTTLLKQYTGIIHIFFFLKIGLKEYRHTELTITHFCRRICAHFIMVFHWFRMFRKYPL